jgi:prepilin signal peptidase PulO-like enzyme (type II secretory pathway)
MTGTAVAAAIFFLIGASVGSFLNVVADRLPAGQSLLHPPSHCPNCGRRLTPLELVPALSYLALRGKCFQCKAPIPFRVFLVELGAGLLAAYLWLTLGLTFGSIAIFTIALLLVLLALIDLDHGIIPDLIVYPGLGLALLLAPWWARLGVDRTFLGSEAPTRLFLGSLAGAALGAGLFALVIGIYALGAWAAKRGGGLLGMGWGDVSLAAFVGAAAGLPGTAVALYVAIMTGGASALFLLLTRRRARRDAIPFGPFLALGGIVSLLWGLPLWNWYTGFR